jgi:hypothetical protein
MLVLRGSILLEKHARLGHQEFEEREEDKKKTTGKQLAQKSKRSPTEVISAISHPNCRSVRVPYQS